jgi:glycerol-3-phosphate cytidylyltransferase-like family protein
MFLYNKYPLFSFNERYTMLKYCKYIDHIVTKVPYISEIDTLKRYKCNKFVYAHNDKNINLENTITYNSGDLNMDHYKLPKIINASIGLTFIESRNTTQDNLYGYGKPISKSANKNTI